MNTYNNSKKKVTTTIDSELWKEAQIRDLSFSTALELGLKFLLGYDDNLEKLKERKKKLQAEIVFLDKQIEKVEQKRKEKEQFRKIIEEHRDELIKSLAIVKRNPVTIKGRTVIWNRLTGMMLTETEFWELLKKFERGEI